MDDNCAMRKPLFSGDQPDLLLVGTYTREAESVPCRLWDKQIKVNCLLFAETRGFVFSDCFRQFLFFGLPQTF